MSNNRKTRFPVKRLVLDAILIAIYVVLGAWRIPIGNMLRVSVAPFAVILCALTFGPVDGMIVGFFGEFITQVTGPYGLTVTTPLWCLGEFLRGGSLGLLAWLFMKNWIKDGWKISGKQLLVLMASCLLTGVLASFGNTLALYVDSKMFGYYEYHVVFGILAVRLCLNGGTACLLAYIALPILSALKKAKLI